MNYWLTMDKEFAGPLSPNAANARSGSIAAIQKISHIANIDFTKQ